MAGFATGAVLYNSKPHMTRA